MRQLIDEDNAPLTHEQKRFALRWFREGVGKDDIGYYADKSENWRFWYNVHLHRLEIADVLYHIDPDNVLFRWGFRHNENMNTDDDTFNCFKFVVQTDNGPVTKYAMFADSPFGIRLLHYAARVLERYTVRRLTIDGLVSSWREYDTTGIRIKHFLTESTYWGELEDATRKAETATGNSLQWTDYQRIFSRHGTARDNTYNDCPGVISD